MKQAPGWNEIVRKYSGHDSIAFGDVNGASEKIRTIAGTAQPVGKTGWPTIRYFNHQTGYGGAAYQQKITDKVCDELRQNWRM